MNMKLKWGILGTGKIAGTFAEALALSNTGELFAVGSRSQESADAFAQKYSVPRAYATYDAMLADPQVQAVYVSLPNHLHCEWTIRCAEACKHILCEKPLATNEGEAMIMLEAVRRAGVFFMEAFMYRCHPQSAKIAGLIRDGAIGEVRVIQAQFAYNMGGHKPENIRQQNEAAGGGIMDVGCYAMSMARLVAGAAEGKDFAEPLEIKASAHIGNESRIDEWATASVKFPGEVLANLVTGTQVSVDSTLRIWGTAGSLFVPNPWFPGGDGSASTLTLQRAGQEPEEITVTVDAPLYTWEADTVARSVQSKQIQASAPCMTWQDSLGQQRALDAWRCEVGLVFDRELPEALSTPFSGRPLEMRAERPMPMGTIEGLHKPVSRIVIGSMVAHTTKLPYTFALFDHFFEQGGNCIDTAWVYGGGGSEGAVGEWVRRRGVRDDIVLICKGAHAPGCTPEGLTEQLNVSLERLSLDYVDIYMMHRDDPSIPVEEFVDVLNEHHRAGRIGIFGGSNWSIERLKAANEYAAAKGLQGFAVSSPNYSLAQWNEPMWVGCVSASDAASREWYSQTQLPLFAWSSQASGMFTGRYSPDTDRNRDWTTAEVARVWFNEANFARLERVQKLAQQKCVTTTQIALAYVLSQPLNIYALIGPQNLNETNSSLAALDVRLSPEEVRWLEQG